ncbi:MAG: hypothetical protein JXR83_00035 [Deltaproteobacteria bacterium]|nr:hypothetical protein [Deltaproteobacteria bacterium]
MVLGVRGDVARGGWIFSIVLALALLVLGALGCGTVGRQAAPTTPSPAQATSLAPVPPELAPWTLERFARIPATPSRGFNWPYYLLVPADVRTDGSAHLLVEPNNTGRPSDDFEVHDDSARKVATRDMASQIARRLKTPLLVPVFPRPENQSDVYTHALDRDTLLIADGPLARIDLQLIHMIDDARDRLSAIGIRTHKKVQMTGFSASGSFVNRFAILHPDRVRAVATGGVNGIPMVATPQVEGRQLRFPVGTFDLAQLSGKRVDMDAYRQVSQFIYMGYLDHNDTLPFRDAYDETDAQLTIDVLGDSMPTRWETSHKLYTGLGIPAQFVTYNGVGHEVRQEMIDDIVGFLQTNWEPGFHPVEPHAYPFVASRELERITVHSAWWRGDPAIPAPFRTLFDGKGDIVLAHSEWLEGQDYRQLNAFRKKATLRLELRAPKREVIILTDENIVGSVCDGDGMFQGFVLALGPTKLDLLVPGVAYEMRVMDASGKPSLWIVRPGVTITRPSPGVPP